MHPVWWVRMYAAGAAAVAGDLVHLEKLAYDANDNVREAAIEPLRRLKKARPSRRSSPRSSARTCSCCARPRGCC